MKTNYYVISVIEDGKKIYLAKRGFNFVSPVKVSFTSNPLFFRKFKEEKKAKRDFRKLVRHRKIEKMP